MRIIGIDPGLRITGFGLIDQDGQQLRYVTSGVIRTPDSSLPLRIKSIFDGVAQVIGENHPEQAAIEMVFVNINPASTLALGQARGAAICALVTANLPVTEYTALQLKKATVGRGQASKDQVQFMVQRLLSLPGLPSPDAADALACAICHAQTRGIVGSLRAKSPAAGARGLRLRGGRIVG